MADTSFTRQVSPLIAAIGSRYYFTPETAARGDELGLDLFSFYFLGRGGVLGDVEAPVVAAAFGYFNPDAIASMWDGARGVLSPREAGRAHLACCADFGRRYLSDLDDLDKLCVGLGRVHAVASRSVATLALYAGMAAEPIPEDPPARAMHLVALLREHRGGVHLAAIVAAGMDPAVAHYLRRPGMWRMFGWRDRHKPVVTELDRRRLAEVDATTDRLVAPAFAVLGGDEQRSVLRGLTAAKAAIGDAGLPPS